MLALGVLLCPSKSEALGGAMVPREYRAGPRHGDSVPRSANLFWESVAGECLFTHYAVYLHRQIRIRHPQ
jgi:hypothetical protein